MKIALRFIHAFLLFIGIHYFLLTGFCFAQAGQWTWMKGDTTTSPNAHFGTQGIADVLNKPPGFYEAAEWKALDGSLWFFGGLSSSYSEYGDLWKYDPSLNQWTWVKGPGISQQGGTYGTLGVPAPLNNPGARSWGSVTWVDPAGDLWLFGGLGYDGNSGYGFLCDLWKYSISSNEWTWVSGPNQGSQPGVYGTQGIPSAANHPGAHAETNTSWVDNDGNLWFFGGWDGSTDYNDLWKFDISTSEWTWMKGANFGGQSGTYGTLGVSSPFNTPGARITYGKWKDAAGNFWLYSGYDPLMISYRNDVWKYDPMINEWTWMSGSSMANATNSFTSLCDPSTANHPSGRHENRACWSDCDGHFWTFGGQSSNGIYSDLWSFDSNTLEWTLVNGNTNLNVVGHYGTQGVAAANNHPKARWGAIGWMDNDCNLWLFGGAAIVSSERLNDLWKFQQDPSCPGSFVCSATCNSSPIAFSAADTSVCQKFCIDFFDASSSNPTSWLWSFPGGSPASSNDQNPTNICYNNPGSYDVTLITTNASGNDTLTLPDYITVYATPSIPTITQTGYTLTASIAANYQWQLNNVDIPGATNQSYSVTQTGYYTVIVSDQHGCSVSATTYVLITGIENVFGDENISIYPNPSNGNFTLECLNCAATDEMQINIYNTLGQIIFSSEEEMNSANGKIEIDLCKGDATHCVSANGVYFMEIKTGNEFLRKKIMIIK